MYGQEMGGRQGEGVCSGQYLMEAGLEYLGVLVVQEETQVERD